MGVNPRWIRLFSCLTLAVIMGTLASNVSSGDTGGGMAGEEFAGPDIATVVFKRHNWAHVEGEILEFGDFDRIRCLIRYREPGAVKWKETSKSIVKRWNRPWTFHGYLVELLPETSYEYKAVAEIEERGRIKEKKSDIYTLITPPVCPPRVETGDILLKTSHWAEVRSRLTCSGGGGKVIIFVRYRKLGDVEWQQTKPASAREWNLRQHGGRGKVYSYMKALEPGYTYQYQAVAYRVYDGEGSRVKGKGVVRIFYTPQY